VPYNNLISRTKTLPLIPEQVSQEILTTVSEQSAALSLFRRIPMSSHTTRMPVLSALPTAYWVAGDTGLKQTTEMAWANKFLIVEEIAAIVPIPENVLEDLQMEIWGTVRPLLADAMGRVLDSAIFFGVNIPASWPTAIVPQAVAIGNHVTRGTAAASAGGIAEDLNQLMAKVEAQGMDINGWVGNRTIRAKFRSARDTTGQKLVDITQDSIDGSPIRYGMSGLWPTGTGAAELVGGDFTQGIIGLRRDVSFKLLTEGVITDNTGAVIWNLPQQDSVALRATMRVAWQVANTINYTQPTEANRYPFAVLRAP
jgi:HK97 family phage major capsid protein